jgi:hypothetical protein
VTPVEAGHAGRVPPGVAFRRPHGIMVVMSVDLGDTDADPPVPVAAHVDVDDDDVVAHADAPAPRGRRRVDRVLLLASMAIAAGIVVIVFGVIVSVTGDDRSPLPDEVESVAPVPDAVQVLSQSQIVVDLVSGYTGVLVVDGVELETVNLDELGSIAVEPGKQVDIPPVTVYEPGNATLTFTPSEGAAIEELDSGLHEATVVYWRITEGRQRADSYRWTFNVI